MNDYYGFAAEAVEDVGLLAEGVLFAQLLGGITRIRWNHFGVVQVYLLYTHHEHRYCVHENYFALVMVR